MTLHALRLEIGDDDFFRLLQPWVADTRRQRDDAEFIALAERISGQDLGDFFQTWLFTPGKPPGIEPAAAVAHGERRGVAKQLSAMRKAHKR